MPAARGRPLTPKDQVEAVLRRFLLGGPLLHGETAAHRAEVKALRPPLLRLNPGKGLGLRLVGAFTGRCSLVLLWAGRRPQNSKAYVALQDEVDAALRQLNIDVVEKPGDHLNDLLDQAA